MQIKVNAPSKTYDIIIEEGLITQKGLPDGTVITDTNLAKIYPGLIRDSPLKISPGERNKNLSNYGTIVRMLSLTENKETIVAFGGGVVGDLAGFIASTYKRGLNFVQVPTSLLAMVDSSIGGKNGLNLGEKKNYLGTIYQPDSVLIDPLFLNTLPKTEFKNGLAEIIKYSTLFGKPELNKLRKISKEDLTDLIYDCCEVKARVVEKDEKDLDYRHVLNFGHTIGHAIELLYSLSHGEAVSIGMVKELELGKKTGLVTKEKIKKIKEILTANSLPTEFPENFDLERVLELIEYDKKGKFIFAFDEVNYNVQLNEKIIREVLKCS